MAAAKGHKKAVIDHCYADKKGKYYLVKKINRNIQLKLQAMCSKKVNSVLQREFIKTAKDFRWQTLISVNVPVLTSILYVCTVNNQKKNRDGIIGMCAAMILNFRNNRMCQQVYKIIGLILYSGHNGKEVYF